MGVTIAYRGRLADLTRVEDFEDRLVDFASRSAARCSSGGVGPTTITIAWSAASSSVSRRVRNAPVYCCLLRDGLSV